MNGNIGYTSTLIYLDGATIVGGFHDYYLQLHFYHNSGVTMTLKRMVEIDTKIISGIDAFFTDLTALFETTRSTVIACYNAPSYIGISWYRLGAASTSY